MVNVLNGVVCDAEMGEAVFVGIKMMRYVTTVSAAIVIVIVESACGVGACPDRIGGLVVSSVVEGRGGAVVVACGFGACPDRIGGLKV